MAFQPHRYTRTRDLWDDFIAAFNHADVLFVTEVYAAGEEKIQGAEAMPLVEAIRAHGHRNAHYVADLDELATRVVDVAQPGDLIVTLGAGSISGLGTRIVGLLEEGS